MEKIISFIFICFIFVACNGCKKDEETEPSPYVYLNIISVSPENRATEVPIDTTITIKFDHELDLPETISDHTWFNVKGGIRASINGTLNYNSAEKTITFDPTGSLTPEKNFNVVISSKGFKGKAGEIIVRDYSFSFETGLAIDPNDKIPPVILDRTPLENAIEVSVLDFKLDITFDENIDSSSVNNTTCKLKAGGQEVPGIFSLDPEDKTIIRFSPNGTQPIKEKTEYQVVIEGIKDLNHNLFISTAWSFKTVDIDVDLSAVLLQPANGATRVGTNLVVKIQFNKDIVEDTIRKDDNSSDSFFLIKKDDMNPVLARVNYDKATKVASLSPSGFLESDAIYNIILETTIKTYSGQFFVKGVPWSFTTGSVTEIFKEKEHSPLSNAVNISVSDPHISVIFNRKIDPATANKDTFIVKNALEEIISGEYQTDITKTIFIPQSPLIVNTVYTVSLTEGIKEKDILTSNLEPYTWSFTTAAEVRPATITFTANLTSDTKPDEDWSSYTIVTEETLSKKIILQSPDSIGDFSLTLPTDKTYVVSLLDNGSHYASTLVLNREDPAQVIIGLKAVEDYSLGKITVDDQNKTIFLQTSLALTDKNLDPIYKVRANAGIPVGAGNWGKGLTAKRGISDSLGVYPDSDRDGILDNFDADNDGNGVIDEVASALVNTEGLEFNDIIKEIILTQELVMDFPAAQNYTKAEISEKRIIKLEVIPKDQEIAGQIQKIIVSKAPDYYKSGKIATDDTAYQFPDIVTPTGETNLDAYPSIDQPWNENLLYKGIHLQENLYHWVVWLKFGEQFGPGDIFEFQITFKNNQTKKFVKMVNFSFSDHPRLVTTNYSTGKGTCAEPFPVVNQSPVFTWLRPKDESGNELIGMKYSLTVGYYNIDCNNIGSMDLENQVVSDLGLSESINSGDIFKQNLPTIYREKAIKKYAISIIAKSPAGDKTALQNIYFEIP